MTDLANHHEGQLAAAVIGMASLVEKVDAERASGIFRFFDTVDAYDATQCREDIEEGAILIVESDKVVGFLVEAWPVAITQEHGEFHPLDRPIREFYDGKYVEAAARAATIARDLGYTVRPDAEVPAEPEPDVIRLAARAYRGTGKITVVHVNCICKIKTSLIGTYATVAEAEKAAADHRPGVPTRRCKLSAPLRTPVVTEFAAGDRVLCPDGSARTVVGMFRVPSKPPQVLLEGGGNDDASACTLVDTSRIPEARKAASLAAERVRTNPDPTDEGWQRALAELTQELRYLEVADPVYAKAAAEVADEAERVTVDVPRPEVVKGDILHAMGARLTVLDHGVTSSGARGLPQWWADVIGVDEDDRAKTYRTAWTLSLNMGDASWDMVTVERAIPAPPAREAAPARPGGATFGSAPRHAGHPDVIAAREALRPLRPATLTDQTEVTEPHRPDPELRGYMLEPRGPGRVAAFWVEGGRAIAANNTWHGPSVGILADKLRMAGWTVTRPTGSGICTFAERPADRD
ncbi:MULTISPECIES: hypothetical protein [unclassified Streptomyces]|uniref:hypothetical protein n=1 Tax=unclassified Streptomyces TaxID=2593676 RepID=UPI000367772F|nr:MULTISPECIES: hypothetical protein [unclassified Streptomyces]MYX36524.1 hypothetical protein [Streptomyces sp. SID8377]